MKPLELWGGIECTVNRVGDRWLDQVERTGHHARGGDLERIAALGIRTLRYPLLWERTAPDRPDRPDWRWADERLARLRALGIRPIAGLLHHGSGPRYAGMLDFGFAEAAADFAGRAAERYPWIDAWTPVNEPLTTARFSALYGHWYPHRSDDLSFARALLAQCRAVALCMRAVRAVRQDAKLVQTEDLAKTHSVPALRYQADFENERRWLTGDLLTGRVSRAHPMGDWLLWLGVEARELMWFADNPCPPDIMGFNHYATSERFLDDDLERYPPGLRGGNGRHAYADTEAVRVDRAAGPEALLLEAHARFGLPLALTEAHLGCTREEQMRWLAELWNAAKGARAAGADVRAVTAWALLGAYDWDTLATRAEGSYEAGAFDVRGPRPRPTGIAFLLRQLAEVGEPRHPVLDTPGWWRR
ncbi:MAG: dTDP-4-dehydrorhamnose reductase, partial [Gemmataceae bacterium]|nr:dTDP-4-dehydrorhamnose reductase [Gemmataceae bacterium]